MTNPANKRINRAWLRFEQMVVPEHASDVQRAEMRKAFFAGAATLFRLIVDGVSDGEEATDGDMELMDGISEELDEFGRQLDAEVFPQSESN